MRLGTKQYLRPMLMKLGGSLFLLATILLFSASSAQAILITRTSITNFYTDISGSPSRRCNYVSYTINNNDGVAYSQVWVTIGSFSGGVVGLAPTEDGVVNIGSLAIGEVKAAFFYLCANTSTTTDQGHTITVFNGPPSFSAPLGSASFTLFNVEDTIQANANKVNTVVAGPTPPELGGLVTITVSGDSGTIGAENIMAFTAAVVNNWPANAYELYASSITLSGGTIGTYSNILWIPPASLGGEASYVATFYLRAVGTTASPTQVSPTAYISSGANTKHTATDPASLPPIDPTDNHLFLRKTASPTNFIGTGLVTFTLTLTNAGLRATFIDTIVDTLPSFPGSVTYVAGSSTFNGAPIPNPNVSGQVVTWPGTFTLPAGSTRALTFQGNFPATFGSYTNRAIATVGPSQVDTTQSTADNAPAMAVVSTIEPNADVAVFKSGPTNTVASSNFSYTITVTNFGPNTVTNLTVADTLPGGTLFVSANSGGAHSNGVVRWVVAAMALNTGTNFTLTVTAPSNAVTLTNIAAASSPMPDLVATNNNGSSAAARVVTVINAAADLVGAKSGPTNVIASSNLTYTISVTNLGPSTATNIAVSDTLPTGVTFLSAAPAGTLSNNIVSWPLVPTLGVGAVTNFTLTVTAPADGGSITNTAVVTSPISDPNPGNNNGTGGGSRVVTTVDGRADLAVGKLGATNIIASSNLLYTIAVTNLGPSTASNVIVSDLLPAASTFVSASAGGAVSNSVVTWPALAGLAPGGITNFTVTIAAPPDAGTITNIVSASSATTDPSPANNDGSSAGARVVTAVSAAADVLVLKSGPVAVPVTSNFTYVIIATNLGPSTATNVLVLDLLPTDATFVSASAGGTLSNNVVTWPVLALLAANTGTNFSITLAAPASPMNLTNVATGSAETFDPNPGNNDGSSANSRVITAVGAAGATISGFVYLDANFNGFKDSAEAGPSLAGLFAKIFPSSTPTGPAIAATPVDPVTGAYALSNILGGVYHVVIDTGATLSDVTPSLPAGWSGTEMPTQLRTNIAVTAVNVPNQNFGLVNALTITGRVFRDTGEPGGTANDGILNGTEAGLAGVIVRLTDNSGATTYDTATTDGNGGYALLVPNTLSNGVTLKIVEANPPAHLSSGASVGTTGGTYSRTNDTIAFNFTTGTAYTGVNFGDVPANAFSPDGQLAGLPGTFVVYPHTFVAGSAGSVVFSVASAPSPALTGWSQVLYLDANCNGALDANENPIIAPFAVAAGDKVCVLVKEFIPLIAPFNAQDMLTVNANFTYTAASPALATTSTRTDLTTVGNPTTAGLTLLKSVDKPAALPGETLIYTVTYANNSAEPLANIVIYDTTPAFTTFLSATNGTLPTNLTAVAISAPGSGGSGAIKWTFTGTLHPGGTGAVEFRVNVEQ